MLQKEIDRIIEASLNSIRGFGARASYSQIAPKLHPAILRHISANIEDQITEERKKLLENSSFDYSGGEVKQYYELIYKTLKRGKVFELDYYEQLIRESAAFNVYLLSNPQKTFAQTIFHDDSSKGIMEIEGILSKCYYYDYIKKIIITYARKKNLHYFDYQDFKKFIAKAYKELLGAYPRTILDGTITAIGDFSSIAGGGGSRIPKDMLIMFLESNYLPDLAEKIRFNSGESDDIKPSDAQKTMHEFFKKDEKGYNLLKTDFVPSGPAFIPLLQTPQQSETSSEESLFASQKNRKAINFNQAGAEVASKTDSGKTSPADLTKETEAVHLVSEEVTETLLPKEKIDETYEPAQTDITKADKVETETVKISLQETIDQPVKEQPADVIAENTEESVDIIELEPENTTFIVEEEETTALDTTPSIEEKQIDAGETESPFSLSELAQNENAEDKKIPEPDEVKEEQSITASEILEEPKVTEPEVIAPAAIPEAVKEEIKAPEPPQAKAPPAKQAPPQRRPASEPKRDDSRVPPTDVDKIAAEFIIDEIINDDLSSVKRTNIPVEPKPADGNNINEDVKPDPRQADMDLGAIMMRNIIVSGESETVPEVKEDRTINKTSHVSGEKDILSYMDNKTISRLVDDVFNDDMEELMFLTEQLEKAASYDEAKNLLEKILKVRKTPQGLKEVDIFKQALKEYFNKKK